MNLDSYIKFFSISMFIIVSLVLHLIFVNLKILNNRTLTLISPHTLRQNLAALFYDNFKIKIYRSEIQTSIIRLYAKRPQKACPMSHVFKELLYYRIIVFQNSNRSSMVGNKVFIILKIHLFECNIASFKS